MILILSEQLDIATTKVCFWLKYYEVPFLRVDKENSVDIIDNIEITNHGVKISFVYNNVKYCFDDFCFVWNRRGYFKFSSLDTNKINVDNAKVKGTVQKHFENEMNTLKGFVYDELCKIPHLNDPRAYNINKLTTLNAAKEVVFSIPETLITKGNPYKYLETPIITKNIQDVLQLKYKEIGFGQSASKVEEIKNKNEKFAYSLFQSEKQKTFEIRVFVFNKKSYSVAIFSKDFRNKKANSDSILGNHLQVISLVKCGSKIILFTSFIITLIFRLLFRFYVHSTSR